MKFAPATRDPRPATRGGTTLLLAVVAIIVFAGVLACVWWLRGEAVRARTDAAHVHLAPEQGPPLVAAEPVSHEEQFQRALAELESAGTSVESAAQGVLSPTSSVAGFKTHSPLRGARHFASLEAFNPRDVQLSQALEAELDDSIRQINASIDENARHRQSAIDACVKLKLLSGEFVYVDGRTEPIPLAHDGAICVSIAASNEPAKFVRLRPGEFAELDALELQYQHTVEAAHLQIKEWFASH